MDVRVQQTLVQYSSVGEFVFWQMGTYLGKLWKHHETYSGWWFQTFFIIVHKFP